jgi:hypothetical protein
MKKFPQKELRFDEKELYEFPNRARSIYNKEGFIDRNEFPVFFVGSGCDMFCPDVPDEWIISILKRIQHQPHHFFFQSKNPKRFTSFVGNYPRNSIFCTTVETDTLPDGISKAPDTINRLIGISVMKRKYHFKTMITIEPIMKFSPFFADIINGTLCDQVNIGADTMNSNLPEPSMNEVIHLIEDLFPKVHQKTNLKRIIGGWHEQR